jgi:hypothetical protein
MRLFTCSGCENLVYFESVSCIRCGFTLGFVPEDQAMAAFEAAGDGVWSRVDDGHRHRMCANYAEHAVCNWMVGADDGASLCVACRLNRTIPDLSVAENKALWSTLETEKRRLVYSLLRLGLPVIPRSQDDTGLEFDFLADVAPPFDGPSRVRTGHAKGRITLNIAEANPAERARMREEMEEPYRTTLGHFRHESGHYYWDRLVCDGPWLEGFRKRFNDERIDYGKALERHYANGPPADWQERFVSPYASCHPWEDWAETWAHYLHIVDTLETAYQFGLGTRPRAGDLESLDLRLDFDSYAQDDFEALIDRWLPLTFALNSLNRSMGHEHAYPFVLAPAVIEKLGFVHRVLRNA